MRAPSALTLLAAAVAAAGCEVVREAPPSVPVVTVDLRPTTVSPDEFRHGLVFSVRVTNHGTRTVAVRMVRPGSPTATPAGFGVRIMRADGTRFGGNYLAPADSVARLVGGQTRRRAFRLVFGTDAPTALPPGDYAIVGSYGEIEGEPVRLHVRS